MGLLFLILGLAAGIYTYTQQRNSIKAGAIGVATFVGLTVAWSVTVTLLKVLIPLALIVGVAMVALRGRRGLDQARNQAQILAGQVDGDKLKSTARRATDTVKSYVRSR